jgi:hypothetical protein
VKERSMAEAEEDIFDDEPPWGAFPEEEGYPDLDGIPYEEAKRELELRELDACHPNMLISMRDYIALAKAKQGQHDKRPGTQLGLDLET